jgi:hypothetical protein
LLIALSVWIVPSGDGAVPASVTAVVSHDNLLSETLPVVLSNVASTHLMMPLSRAMVPSRYASALEVEAIFLFVESDGLTRTKRPAVPDRSKARAAAQNAQTKAPRRLCLRAAADTVFASTDRDLPIVVVPRFSIALPRYESAKLGGAHFPEHNFHCYENEFSILKLN